MSGIRLRAATFAARIAGRHRRRVLRRGIGLPLAAAARVSTQHVVHRHTRFGDVINARLEMRLQAHRKVVTHRTPARTDLRSPQAAVDRRAITTAPESGRRRIPIADLLPMRARRIEAAPAGPRRVAPVATPSPEIARPRADETARARTAMPLVAPKRVQSKREGGRADTDRSAGDGPAARAEEARARSAMRAKQGPRPVVPSFPEGEIERLADRVIGSIDRRIAAQRERLGRF